jgi:sec-independent protein translocase protein TatA
MGLDNPVHILILLLIILLVFGAKRLPEIGKSLGEGMRGFKDSISGQPSQPSEQTSLTSVPAPAPPAPAPAPVTATAATEAPDAQESATPTV